VGQQTIRGSRVAIILIGPNGLALDPQGRVAICAMPDRKVVRLEKDGSRTTLAERFEGKRLNGPNDVVVKSNGAGYFSDTINGIRGGATGPSRELPFNGFYLVKDGAITYLGGDRDQGKGAPNGLTHSPDLESCSRCILARRRHPTRVAAAEKRERVMNSTFRVVMAS
jgi:gluconolactonase